MSLPGLYAVLDAEAASASGWTLPDLAAAVLDGGATLLQVRGKALSSLALLESARRIVAMAEPYRAIVVINDRADVAALAGAGGVHVGQDDIPPAAARAIVGPEALVGLSTHTADQIAASAGEPLTYLAVGPVFTTATKATGYAPVGLDLVRHAAGSGRTVVAIGGVTLDRVRAVLAAGAASVAVVGDLFAGAHPTERTRALVAEAAAGLAARRAL